VANLDALMTSARTGDTDKDEWRTPKYLYDKLNVEFNFTLDPAATEENALCDNFFTKEQDGLKQDWRGHNSFVNPPYSQLKTWVKKGYDSTDLSEKETTVVMLIPARTDTQAWWTYIRWGDVRFLKGRLKFGMSKEETEKLEERNIQRALEGKKPISSNNSAPFPSAIVVFESGFYKHRPTTFYWDI
jgi:phage N-6-adenine-methyltransferase